MKKDNKVLKFFTPILAMIYTITIIFVQAIPRIPDEFNVTGILLSNLLQFVFVFITLFICIKIYPKVFENPNYCKIKIPSLKKIIGIFLVVPFVMIILYTITYSIYSGITNGEIITKEYISENIFMDVIMSISAVFLSPIIEELGFRFMTISPFKKKSHQIIVLTFISLIFGLMHVTNFVSSFIHSLIIYGAVFITTKNIVYSILVHSAFNFYALIFAILSSKQVMTIKMIELPTILIFDETSHVIFGIISIIGVIMLAYNKKQNKIMIIQKRA